MSYSHGSTLFENAISVSSIQLSCRFLNVLMVNSLPTDQVPFFNRFFKIGIILSNIIRYTSCVSLLSFFVSCFCSCVYANKFSNLVTQKGLTSNRSNNELFAKRSIFAPSSSLVLQYCVSVFKKAAWVVPAVCSKIAINSFFYIQLLYDCAC